MLGSAGNYAIVEHKRHAPCGAVVGRVNNLDLRRKPDARKAGGGDVDVSGDAIARQQTLIHRTKDQERDVRLNGGVPC